MLYTLPLDACVNKPATLTQVVPGDRTETPIWDRYREIIAARTGMKDPFETVERFAFYERAKKACAVVATGKSALYGNVILHQTSCNKVQTGHNCLIEKRQPYPLA